MNCIEEIYKIIYNNQPMSCAELHAIMKDPPPYKDLLNILWFHTPGIRVYKQNISLSAYFTPNKYSNPERYEQMLLKYKNRK